MRTDTSPTARALLTLELVQASPGITADRLADQLGVSERAARRYVGILREAGIPVESVRGPYGGYRLGRGLRLPPLMFSATEALGLVMAVLDGHHDAGDPTDLVGGALGKIVRALPEPVAAQAEAVRRHHGTGARPRGRPARPAHHDRPGAGLLGPAGRCGLGYRSEAGSEWVTDVDPWAVVVRHGRWYLLCRSHSADALRRLPDRPGPERASRSTGRSPHRPASTRWPSWRTISPWAGSTRPRSSSTRRPTASHGAFRARLARSTRSTPGRPGWSAAPATRSWYVEQLAADPRALPRRGVGGSPEAARVLGERLLAAGGPT